MSRSNSREGGDAGETLNLPLQPRQNMTDWVPMQIGKFLVIAGVVLMGLGVLLIAGSKVSFFGLGRLPGDIAFRGKNVAFYFPIVSCVVISVLLTLVFWLISLFSRR